jgi:hypothetical protein
LDDLGVSSQDYEKFNYTETQRIGAAVAFLECDGLIVPSARWDCENLVIFADHSFETDIRVLHSKEVDWQQWANGHGLFRD